jgi:hypothetical protein
VTDGNGNRKMLPLEFAGNQPHNYPTISTGMDLDINKPEITPPSEFNSSLPQQPRLSLDQIVGEMTKLSFGQPNRIAELVGIDPTSIGTQEKADQLIMAIYNATKLPGQDFHYWYIEWFRLNRERYSQVWEAARNRTDMLDPVTAQDHSRVWADAIRKVELHNRAHGGLNYSETAWLDDHMRRIKAMYHADRHPGEGFESWKVRRQKEIMEDLKRVTRAETEKDIAQRAATYDEEPMSAAVYKDAQGNVMYVHCQQGNVSWKKYPDGTIEYD